MEPLTCQGLSVAPNSNDPAWECPDLLNPNLRFLLLQIRNDDDPMRSQEVGCFTRTLGCAETQITPHNSLAKQPSAAMLARHDVVLMGGSGDYSATSLEAWIEPILRTLRGLAELSKPTFASCWGFQAMARALGGEVIHDVNHAELGTNPVRLTDAGRRDPVFGPLVGEFLGQMGHEDCVVSLPEGATLLASTDRMPNQAYVLQGKPIYCTQFHPELDRRALLERLEAYPRYVQKLSGLTLDEFQTRCHDTPEAAKLLPRFVRHVLD